MLEISKLDILDVLWQLSRNACKKLVKTENLEALLQKRNVKVNGLFSTHINCAQLADASNVWPVSRPTSTY